MADTFLSIGIDLPVALQPGSPLPRALPTLSLALQTVATEAHALWREYAAGRPLPDGRVLNSRTGAYANSIEISQPGDLHWRVSTSLGYAAAIEHGTPAYDMKRALSTSTKVRLTKEGKRYLIIPFRHGTPGSVGFSSTMPAHVHELARALSASRVKSAQQVPNVIGVHDIHTRALLPVTRRTYSWGERLPAGLVSKAKAHHATDRFAGLVRFDAPQKGHSQFLTFRVMSEDSPGWQRPAQPGMHITQAVRDEIAPRAQKLFADALAHDIEGLLNP
ncbi:hypothetical protein [Nevskia sp.]|uniref:hypothetical protein n=1 Tax=Nevskia sp. TaxID=1929292 RepID=UPI0025EAF817|nr:hypothetical protein [Nevskia sp.]